MPYRYYEHHTVYAKSAYFAPHGTELIANQINAAEIVEASEKPSKVIHQYA